MRRGLAVETRAVIVVPGIVARVVGGRVEPGGPRVGEGAVRVRPGSALFTTAAVLAAAAVGGSGGGGFTFGVGVVDEFVPCPPGRGGATSRFGRMTWNSISDSKTENWRQKSMKWNNNNKKVG